MLFPVTQPKTHYGTRWSSQAGCPLGKPLDNILQGQSNGSAIIPVHRRGTVKLMAMTDGSVMPSSRTQTMRELFHPTLLPGVTAHPAKPRTPGQEQSCQFVTQCSSGAARLGERAAGSIVGKGCIPGKKGSTDGSRWQLWIAPVGIARAFLETSSVKTLLCCQGCCAALCNHLATSVVLN